MAFGKGTSSGSRTYFSVNEGLFTRKVGDQTEGYNFIEGNLESISIYTDVSDKYGSKVKGRVVLKDNEGEYNIQFGAFTAFGKMFAGYLDNIRKGEFIRMEASHASDNKKVSTCFVLTADRGDYEKVPYNKISAPTEADLADIISSKFKKHESYIEYTVKDDSNGTGVERLAAVIKKIGFPDPIIHTEAYDKFASRILKRQVQWSKLTNEEADRFADAFLKNESDYASGAKPKPEEFNDIEEYDPFADF